MKVKNAKFLAFSLVFIGLSSCEHAVELPEEYTPSCETANVSYNSHIQPILSENCVGCHSGGSPSGGIDLSTYANVKIQADNGKLIGAVEAQPGFVAMPLNGNSIDDCSISQLNSWVTAGALNN